MSDLVTIQAASRSETGKGYARKLRKKGLIPANILGNAKSTSIELDPKWLSKAWKTTKQFELDFAGSKKVVKIQELHVDPVKRIPLHVDLMYV